MKETTRYFIGSATREALIGLGLEPRWQDQLEKGVVGLENALATQDPELLTESLDMLAMVALQRPDRSQTPIPAALLLRDVLDALFSVEGPAMSARSLATARRFRRALLEWWYETWLAQMGRHQIRAFIAGPQHAPLVEEQVRALTREQVTAYPVPAKEKLVAELEVEREEAEREAEELRRQGREQEADHRDGHRVGIGWAIEEVEASITAR
ncbi:MAG: hypothetical protein H6712_30740 [Myxococcales bacterium]|nr:hypothetical protein [Myxococcales bacterium]MCB9718268.1 hypothetical protein [Myxococcales bacterium]